jgi:hypothetical protein
MLNANKTKKLLREFSWQCYEFWANELDTDDEKEMWCRVIVDVEGCQHDPFVPKGELLDAEAKAEFIKELKLNLGI